MTDRPPEVADWLDWLDWLARLDRLAPEQRERARLLAAECTPPGRASPRPGAGRDRPPDRPVPLTIPAARRRHDAVAAASRSAE